MTILQPEDIDVIITDQHWDELTDGRDTTLIDRMEQMAWQEITAYLRTRYDVEEIKTNIAQFYLIKRIMVDILAYHLVSRLSPKNIPEQRQTRYERAVEMLDDIRDGVLHLDLPDLNESLEGDEFSQIGPQIRGQKAQNWFF